MGIETANQAPIGRIDPGSLIGRPDANIITPTATAALSDAFRSGFITADDVINRVDAGAQQKKKLELEKTNQQLSDMQNPDFIEARRLQMQEHIATSKANIMKAEGALNVIPAQLRAEEADAKLREFSSGTFGAGPKMMDLFTSAGASIPTQADGKTPDVEAMKAKLPQVRAFWQRAQQAATIAAHTKPQEFKDANGVVTRANFNSILNRVVSDADQKKLNDAAFASFDKSENSGAPNNVLDLFGPTPGQAVAVPVTDEILKARGVLAGEGLDTSASGMSDQNVQKLIQSRSGVPAAKPTINVPVLGQPSAALPGGIVIGEAPVKVAEKTPKIPSEGAEKLALAREAIDIANGVQTAYNELIASDPEFTGVVQGRLAKIIDSKRWNTKVSAFESKVTELLAPLAKGIYNETGVLSDKDVERYKSVLPDLRDNPKVGARKVADLQSRVAGSFSRKLDTWDKLGYDVSGLKADAVPVPAASAAFTPATAKSAEVKGVGNVILGTDGKYYIQR